MGSEIEPLVRAFVGLGSNLDDPVSQVTGALEELDRMSGSQVVSVSGLYRSEPLGPANQPDFVNAVAAVRTQLLPEALLAELQAIERRHGRVRGAVRWGPRTLDLDLLLYGDQVLALPGLMVPHPGLRERSFALYPLAEIAPALEVPGLGTVNDLLAACPSGALQRLSP